MKEVKIIVAIALLGWGISANAQSVAQANTPQTSSAKTMQQSDIFKAHLVNDEYQIWLDIDFTNQNITVPGQEIFGELPGYLGAKRDTRKWIISEVSVKGKTAKLVIINDYGSEDLTAELYRNSNGTYTLKQLEGSPIKIVVDRKWLKLPKEMVLIKK